MSRPAHEVTVVRQPAALVRACDEARAAGHRVGVVPTMGALHDGHLSLVEEARRGGADFLVVTIFVNPMQFGPTEDLDRYPRTLDADIEACRSRGVDLVFAPEDGAMYPDGFSTHVEVTRLTETLEGAHRPGHFRGVTTVVAKLLNLTAPCVAVFGRKDYQQWRVLARMAIDLDLRAEIRSHPIVREPDGLALSSRNRYLSETDRRRALCLSRGLDAAGELFDAGERDPEALRRAAEDVVRQGVDSIDYVALVDAEDLTALAGTVDRPVVVLIAAHVGTTRLIDNRVLTP